ncbi:SPRY domain-containing SOCS box protein 3 [Bombina bombina]|uniref:SPRY domain-containing SOCS box protein 3 n=1 Tax=Bombina bombina TaxID=8345 RepID=UPI00235AA3A9|nr:SPRY domain-containing SOCS box protein 3 [Bombina bombina]XP_053552470.1 SPRY domain-containing SOCS box protein 3 [Bombina bombina]XP_053576278.1 SPRY domain-containing SOCS box protein 3 [Bombina bombina]XP_053576279.1 SPRY domain-containing SOCS box protein 3 [Bombina bombina]
MKNKSRNQRVVSLDPPMPRGYVEASWAWDVNIQSPDTVLSPCKRAVYFHIDPVIDGGTAGVRGDRGFVYGEHYWEIEFLEPPAGMSVMVGVGTSKAALHAGKFRYIDLLGMDSESWGLSYKGTVWHGGHSQRYTEPFYSQGTVIGVHLNLEEGTLSFYRDGKSLGVAFTGLHKVQSPLYPMVSSTSPGTELELGLRCCSLPSLQERCLDTLAHSLAQKDLADFLPLPPVVKWKLKSWNYDKTQSVLGCK